MSKNQTASLVLLLVSGIALLGNNNVRPVRQSGQAKTDFATIPRSFPGWQSQDNPFDLTTQMLLPTCSLLSRTFINRKLPQEQVNLTIVYGEDLGDFHQPEYCMQGQGWEILRSDTVPVYNQDGREISAARVYIQLKEGDNRRPQVVYYWFAANGRTSTFLGTQKVRMLVDRLLSQKRHSSALVEFWVPIFDGNSQAAEARGKAMIARMVPSLDRTLSPAARR